VKEHLRSVELKTGETMDVVRVTCPDHEFRDRILPFLAHKGPDWQVPMRENLAAPLEGLAQHFYLGLIGDQVVGNASHIEALERPVAILQHVFVPPERRRQGICSAIIHALADDFVARGGRASFLHTGYQSPPYYIYQSAGFVGYRDTGTMEWFPDPTFKEAHFAPGATHVRDTRWADWALLEALYGTVEGWFLRSVHFGQWGRSGYEGHYIYLRKEMAEGGVGPVKVLASDTSAVVGHAYLSRDGRFRGSTSLLDLFVHPRFRDRAGVLLDAIDMPAGTKVQSYVDSSQPEKAELLRARGFEVEATLPRQVERDGAWLDVSIYALHP
jgi:GNAT superfamily N-acetyltransferase